MRTHREAEPFSESAPPRPWSEPRAGASVTRGQHRACGARVALPPSAGQLRCRPPERGGTCFSRSGHGTAPPSPLPLQDGHCGVALTAPWRLSWRIPGGACTNPYLFRSLYRAKPSKWDAWLSPGLPPAPARLPRPSQHEVRVIDRKSWTDPW